MASRGGRGNGVGRGAAGWGRALAAGAAGAAAVTAVNAWGRGALSDAPRLDLLGEGALSRLGLASTLRRRQRRRAALAGDLVANTLYYALVRPGRSARPLGRGLLLGTAAGVAAVILGPRLAGHRPTDATVKTAVLAVAWYAFGGLAAGLAARAFARRARARA